MNALAFVIGSMKTKKIPVHHLQIVAPAGRLQQLLGPIKRLPSSLKLVILQCAVPASRPVEELAATVAKKYWECLR